MALIIGGIFSFLPVLGLWMLPLGLILIAEDLPFLQGPMARMLGWIERKWLVAKSRETHFVRLRTTIPFRALWSQDRLDYRTGTRLKCPKKHEKQAHDGER